MYGRLGGREGGKTHRVIGEPDYRRIGVERHVEAPRVPDLRDEAEVRKRRRIAEYERADARINRQPLLQRRKAEIDPVSIPGCFLLIRDAERPRQILEHAQVIHWMNVARHLQGHGAHINTIQRGSRQQRGLRVHVVQIVDDRKRLREHVRLTVDGMRQRRHQPIGIDRTIRGLQLLAAIANKMDRRLIERNRFQRQRDPHPIRRRAAKVAMQRGVAHASSGAGRIFPEHVPKPTR